MKDAQPTFTRDDSDDDSDDEEQRKKFVGRKKCERTGARKKSYEVMQRQLRRKSGSRTTENHSDDGDDDDSDSYSDCTEEEEELKKNTKQKHTKRKECVQRFESCWFILLRLIAPWNDKGTDIWSQLLHEDYFQLDTRLEYVAAYITRSYFDKDIKLRWKTRLISIESNPKKIVLYCGPKKCWIPNFLPEILQGQILPGPMARRLFC